MERIRHIATTWQGDRAVVAQFERRAAVWDLRDRRKIAEFDTVADFGGERLVITPDGKHLVAAAYQRHGIECYAVDSGEMIWQRTELKKAQHVTIDRTGEIVFAGFEGKTARALSVTTGQDVGAMAGVLSVASSPFADVRLLDRKSRPAKLVTPTGGGSIHRTTFAFLRSAFSPSAVAISEATGPVRCFSLADAQELWRVEWDAGVHALELSYVSRPPMFVAVTWNYKKGGHNVLVHLDCESGRKLQIVPIPYSPVYGFCFEGRQLLTWDGSIVATENGEHVAKLPFPNTSAQ